MALKEHSLKTSQSVGANNTPALLAPTDWDTHHTKNTEYRMHNGLLSRPTKLSSGTSILCAIMQFINSNISMKAMTMIWVENT